MLFRQSRSLRHFSNHLLDCSEHLIRLGSSRFSVLRVLTLLKHDSGCFLACLPLAFQSCTLNPAHLLSGHFCTVCMYFLAWFSLTFIFSWSCVSLLCHALPSGCSPPKLCSTLPALVVGHHDIGQCTYARPNSRRRTLTFSFSHPLLLNFEIFRVEWDEMRSRDIANTWRWWNHLKSFEGPRPDPWIDILPLRSSASGKMSVPCLGLLELLLSQLQSNVKQDETQLKHYGNEDENKKAKIVFGSIRKRLATWDYLAVNEVDASRTCPAAAAAASCREPSRIQHWFPVHENECKDPRGKKVVSGTSRAQRLHIGILPMPSSPMSHLIKLTVGLAT